MRLSACFCGRPPDVHSSPISSRFLLTCPYCEVSTPSFASRLDAVSSWNDSQALHWIRSQWYDATDSRWQRFLRRWRGRTV
jgi:hypothetical protein